MSLRTIVLLLFLQQAIAKAGALLELPLNELSQIDPNPLGEKALAINSDQWTHAETEHFIYHYVHSYVANPVAVEAEFYYRVITTELGRNEAAQGTKSHIYIFEKPEDWQQFQHLGELEPWTGAIHSRGSLFVVRNPAYKFQSHSLGHEIVHLVMHRLYPGGIPCWLDEGLAEYLSEKAHASFHRARGYIAKPKATAIASEALMPLRQLVGHKRPPAQQVELFYQQSERLVRFLAGTDKTNFIGFIDALAQHAPFESALNRFYGTHFASVAALDERFRADASRHFGTTLQQTGGL